MKIFIIGNNIINFNNVSSICLNGNRLIFNFNDSNSCYNHGIDGVTWQWAFNCSRKEYQKIIDFLKDKDKTILELNIDK